MTDPGAPYLLLVGAGPGLGVAIARRFGRERFRLGLISRSERSLAPVVAELAAEGLDVHTALGEAGDTASLRAAVDALTGVLGVPDVLVYNVAATPRGGPTDVDPATVVRALTIFGGGLVDAVQAVVPGMRERRRGTILVTGSGVAFDPWVEVVALGMGKAAQRNYVNALYREVIDDEVYAATVTIRGVLAPGTPFDPALVAEEFWAAHRRPREDWEWEITYRGTPEP